MRDAASGLAIEAVTRLHRRGLAAIPCCAPATTGCTAPWHPQRCANAGKRPLAGGFPKLAQQLPRLADLLAAVDRHRRLEAINLAIVIPRGHVVVEADDPDGDAELAEHVGRAMTPIRAARPGRGRAYLFRLPTGVVVR